MKEPPVIDIRECSDCGTCLELCPSVFRKNDVSGFIEVQELPEYPENEIQEVISFCPKGCITWENDGRKSHYKDDLRKEPLSSSREGPRSGGCGGQRA